MTTQSPIDSSSQFEVQSDLARVGLLSAYPLGIGELIDRGFRLYRRHFKAFVLMAAVLLLPIYIANDVAFGITEQNQLSLYERFFPSSGTSQAVEPSTTQPPSDLNFWTLVQTLVVLLFDAITALGLATMSISALRGSPPTLATGFSGIRRNFWSMLRLSVVVIPIAIGVTFAGIIALFVLGLAGGQFFGFLPGGIAETSSQGGQDVVTRIVLAFILFCLMPLAFLIVLGPLVYISLRWSIALPSLIDNSLGARKSLRMSWTLTRGRVWRVAGFLTLLILLTGVLPLIATYLAHASLLLLLGIENLQISSFLGAVFSAALGILLTPLLTICLSMLYFDLRTRSQIVNSNTASGDPAVSFTTLASAAIIPTSTVEPDWATVPASLSPVKSDALTSSLEPAITPTLGWTPSDRSTDSPEMPDARAGDQL